MGPRVGMDFIDPFGSLLAERCEELRPFFKSQIDYLTNLALEKPNPVHQVRFFLEDLSFFLEELVDGEAYSAEAKRVIYQIVAAKVDMEHEDAMDFLSIVHGLIFGHLTPVPGWDRGGMSSELAIFLTSHSFRTDSVFLIEDLTDEAVYEPDYMLPRPASAESIHKANEAYLSTPMSFSVHEQDPETGEVNPLHGIKSVSGETKLALIEALSQIPEFEVEYFAELNAPSAPKAPRWLEPIEVEYIGKVKPLSPLLERVVWANIQLEISRAVTRISE